MRSIPHRKRTWLLALLVVAVAAVWLTPSEKSDFERLFDQIEPGMTGQKVSTVVNVQQNTQSAMSMVGPDWLNPRFSWTFDGEEIAVVLDRKGVVSKEFTPTPTVENLRRQWRRLIRSEPPF